MINPDSESSSCGTHFEPVSEMQPGAHEAEDWQYGSVTFMQVLYGVFYRHCCKPAESYRLMWRSTGLPF